MDFFESLTPLLVLLIWAILAAVANSKKKKAREEQAPTSPETGKPVQPMNETDNPVETLMEKLRRGLEEISEEASQESGKPEEPNPARRRPRTTPPPVPESTDERVRRAEAQQGEKRKKLRQREKPKYTGKPEFPPPDSLKGPQITPSAGPVTPDAYGISAETEKRLPSSNLREGIIWMEILQPPVSLRD